MPYLVFRNAGQIEIMEADAEAKVAMPYLVFRNAGLLPPDLQAHAREEVAMPYLVFRNAGAALEISCPPADFEGLSGDEPKLASQSAQMVVSLSLAFPHLLCFQWFIGSPGMISARVV